MTIDELVDETIGQLKDFQQKTVEVALEKLLKGQNRFLIADAFHSIDRASSGYPSFPKR